MNNKVSLWKTEILVPGSAVKLFESALEQNSIAVMSFDDNPSSTHSDRLWHVQALTMSSPNHATLTARLAAAATVARINPPILHVAPLMPEHFGSNQANADDPITLGRFKIWNSSVSSKVMRQRFALHIECSLAFGTGRHESTQSCLIALDHLAKRYSFNRILDLGTGSGILSLAAARLWRHDVRAVDLDPIAVDIARDNARKNTLHQQVKVIRGDGTKAPTVKANAPYDLILANILAKPLVSLASDIAILLRSSGILVLSGLLTSEEMSVRAAYRVQGLVLLNRIVRSSWSTLILSKYNQRRLGERPVKEI